MMVVGGHLVVAGGYAEGLGHLTSVEAYTPTGWTPLPPLPHYACDATACVLDGRLYVLGGVDCNKLQVLEMSEENGFAWTVKADLPASRHSAASVVHEGRLWLIGGEIDDEPTASVIIYDIASDSWAVGPALPRPIARGRAAELDGEIKFTDETCSLALRNGAWAQETAPPTRRFSPACESVVLG